MNPFQQVSKVMLISSNDAIFCEMGRSSKDSLSQTPSVLRFLQILYYFPYALSFMAFFLIASNTFLLNSCASQRKLNLHISDLFMYESTLRYLVSKKPFPRPHLWPSRRYTKHRVRPRPFYGSLHPNK